MFKNIINIFVTTLALNLPGLAHSSPRIDDANKRFCKTIDEMKSDKYINGEVAKSVKNSFKHAFQTKKPSKTFYSSIDSLKAQKLIFGKTAYHIKKTWEFTAGYLFIKDPITHNSQEWINSYKQQKYKEQKKRRAAIFEQTKTASNYGFYTENGQLTHLSQNLTDQMQKETILYVHPKALTKTRIYPLTLVNVYNMTTTALLQQMLQRGFYPVALNMANKNHPGGGAINGAQAQEESLFRSSDYFLALDPRYNKSFSTQLNGKYFIPEFGLVYTPFVQVFRSDQAQGYAFTRPYSASFIASAAYNYNNRAGHIDAPQNFATYKASIKEKIRGILRIASKKGHDSIILGAYGCGAFGNDPKIISQLFKEVFLEPEFKGQFKELAFAIIDDKNGKNFAPFKETLHGMTF